MVNSAVSISFRYSQAEYARAMRTHYASTMRLWLDIPVLMGTAILGAYFWRSEGWTLLVIFLLSVSTIFGLMLVSAFLIIPALVFLRDPKLRDQYSLTFAEEGIHFNTAHIDSNLEWTLYSRALVDRSCYILYYGRRYFTIIPNRVFQNADQQSEFEKLLTQKIGKIVRKA